MTTRNRFSFLAVTAALLAALLPRVSSGAEASFNLRQCRRVLWSKEQGLPQNASTTMLLTRDGFLWVATEAGLARFDGVGFTTFDARHTPGLKSNVVTALCEDARGRLWVGTGEGVSCLEDGRFRHYPLSPASTSSQVRALCTDGQGQVWVGTAAPGVQCWREGDAVFQMVGEAAELGKDRVIALCADGQGGWWAGLTNGLVHYRAGKVTRRLTSADGLPSVPGPDGVPHAQVTGLCLARDGALWIGAGGGVARWHDETGTMDNNAADLAGLRGVAVRRIFEDPRGTVWVATYEAGLRCFPAGAERAMQSLTAADGLPTDRTTCFCADEEGGVWVGTDGGGLLRLEPPKFASLTAADGLPSVDALTACEDSKGRIWIGTARGLMLNEAGRLTPAAPADADSSDPRRMWVYGTHVDRRGRLWFGTRRGLSCLEDGQPLRTLTWPDVNLKPGAFTEDAQGQLLVNTSLGIMEVVGEGADARLDLCARARELSGGNAFALLTDHAGHVWAATATRGVALLPSDPGGPTRWWGRAQGLPTDRVLALYEDANGALWIGTDGGGLCRLRPGAARVETLDGRGGLASDAIFSIFEDARGQFWLATGGGVERLARAAANDVLDGRARTVQSTVFDENDGLPSAECVGGCWPASCQGADGRLWISTDRGLAIVDPAHVALNTRPPPVKIETVSADDAPPLGPADWARGLSFAPGVRRLELSFAGLSFAAPRKVRYRYRLEGFDPAWVEAGARHATVYTALPPGAYRFRVSACNNDGVWNEEGAALAFVLQPRFYQTGWFKGLAVGALAALVGGAFWWRQRQLQARFAAVLAERTRIAGELHDTCAQALFAVNHALDSAHEELPGEHPVREQLDRAHGAVRQGLSDARTLIASLRGQAPAAAAEGGARGVLAEFIAAVNTEALDFSLEVDERAIARLAPDARHELLCVCREAIHNALKHADAQNVAVRIGSETGHPGWLLATMHDDGRGFDTNGNGLADGQGRFGLRGMRERASRIKGVLEVESAPGAGTWVRLRVPLAAEKTAAKQLFKEAVTS